MVVLVTNSHLQDNIGAVMKCSPDKNIPSTNQYQLELTVHPNGQSWLDLSIVNGQPFTPYPRAAYFPSMGSKCSKLQCTPGDHSCEWCPSVGQTTCTPPRYIVCDTTSADAWMYLCAYGRKDTWQEVQRDCS